MFVSFALHEVSFCSVSIIHSSIIHKKNSSFLKFCLSGILNLNLFKTWLSTNTSCSWRKPHGSSNTNSCFRKGLVEVFLHKSCRMCRTSIVLKPYGAITIPYDLHQRLLQSRSAASPDIFEPITCLRLKTCDSVWT